MNEQELKEEYLKLYPWLNEVSAALHSNLDQILKEKKNIDRISFRAKGTESFLKKALKTDVDTGKLKYNDPFNEIQDFIGGRIIVYYKSDLEFYTNKIRKIYNGIEDKTFIPDDVKEFGYEGQHFILFIPGDIYKEFRAKANIPEFFELQIKTLYQHAWSESNHDLIYKPQIPVDDALKREMAFIAAQSWGADKILQEIKVKLKRDNI